MLVTSLIILWMATVFAMAATVVYDRFFDPEGSCNNKPAASPGPILGTTGI